MSQPSLPRRGFLGRITAFAAGAGLIAADGAQNTAHAMPDGVAPDEAWLTNMKGVHRSIFDTPSMTAARAVPHVRNYLDTYREAYGLADDKVSAAIMAYSSALPMLFDDAAWEKYAFGDSPRNPHASQLNALRARGVTLLGCNNTLRRISGELAVKRGETADAVRADLLTHILPGVIIVPGAVIALNRAQESGITSFYCG